MGTTQKLNTSRGKCLDNEMAIEELSRNTDRVGHCLGGVRRVSDLAAAGSVGGGVSVSVLRPYPAVQEGR